MDMTNNSEPILTGLVATLLVFWGKVKMVSKHELERHEDLCGNRVKAQFDLLHQKQTKTFDKVADLEKTLVSHMASVNRYIDMIDRKDGVEK